MAPSAAEPRISHRQRLIELHNNYHRLWKYQWPAESKILQVDFIKCIILVVAQRVVNILVPIQLGRLIDGLINELSGAHNIPWAPLTLFILFKVLQGPSGLLGALRSLLWTRLSQRTYRALTTAALEHIHSLSLEFHLDKRRAEFLSVLSKGSSVNTFLEQMTFQVLPMMTDFLLAILVLFCFYGVMPGITMLVLVISYLHLTMEKSNTTADRRREMSRADQEEAAVSEESILSYETVHYFGQKSFELRRFRKAIQNFQKAEARVVLEISTLNIYQTLLFASSIMMIIILIASSIGSRDRTIGDFVALLAYLNQLQGVLNFFGTFNRTIQQSWLSAERLLQVFNLQSTMVDTPGSKPLLRSSGHMRLNNVSFSYDKRRLALRNVTFECRPGSTTAIVGESGSGKSTLFRLIFRYYACQNGTIELDGENMEDLTIDSIRRHIGVVPQDIVLFNETLMYNLKYANPQASDEEVDAACQAAAIYNRILSFPDGYDTKVGEQGLRLSGGEKQRIALARALLKNTKFLLLDEATSALDSGTSAEIIARLINRTRRSDHTLLIISHRLTTMTNVDQIVVLVNGSVVETGTHEELLAADGRYTAMWKREVGARKSA